jgi:hypothetical protein
MVQMEDYKILIHKNREMVVEIDKHMLYNIIELILLMRSCMKVLIIIIQLKICKMLWMKLRKEFKLNILIER